MKFFGKIGFENTTESEPGIWTPTITPRSYYGDVNRNQRRWQINEETINDNLNISNEISILADTYLLENLGSMRWVEYGGEKWKISWINLQYPRVILTLSGLYTEEGQDEQA